MPSAQVKARRSHTLAEAIRELHELDLILELPIAVELTSSRIYSA